MRRGRTPARRASLLAVDLVVAAALTVLSPGIRPASATSFGTVHAFGTAVVLKPPPSVNQPLVGMAPTATGEGYWLVARDGGVFAQGDAQFFGSTGNLQLNRPVVGMAATPTGRGYWFVATDGGIFAYGDARFLGSTGSTPLNRPIVGMATTPTGLGYWLVASDGGIFAYGDARFFGSTGGTALNSPIVSMAATRAGDGYWLAAADGGVFTFGTAPYLGSRGGGGVTGTVIAIARRPADDRGYWLLETGPISDRACRSDPAREESIRDHPEVDLLEACFSMTPAGDFVFQFRPRLALSREVLVSRLHPIYTRTERTDSMVLRFDLAENGARESLDAWAVFGLSEGKLAVKVTDNRGFVTNAVPVTLQVSDGVYTFGPVARTYFPTYVARFWFVAVAGIRDGSEDSYQYDVAPDTGAAGPVG